jgi:hypothetical protein
MKSKTSIIILVIVIIIGAVFLVLDRVQAPASTSSVASSTSSIDTSSWKSYSNTQPPFSIEYPTDLSFSTSTIPTIDGPYLLALQFPKDIYFSTVLKDETYVIVTASSTCPAIEPGGRVGYPTPTSISVNSMTFVKNEVSDAAAGNRYLTITYDTVQGGLCYRITFFDHGANGAGLYLSDTIAIQTADATHTTELAKIEAIVTALVGTFFLNTSQ